MGSTERKSLIQRNHGTSFQFEFSVTLAVSPLLIDMEWDGFDVSKAGQGISFDMDSDGVLDHIQWVRQKSNDAFLAIDMNQNGQIDNGGELFGVGTQLLLEEGNTKAADGYQALSQYDNPLLGGNSDGRIDQKDEVWDSLKLWVDANANGFTEKGELTDVAGSRLISFYTKPTNTTDKIIDEAGNYIPLWSWVKTSDEQGPRRVKMVDIYFKRIN